MKQLREYQQQGIDAAYLHLHNRGHRGTLIHMATGLGKTLLATEYVKQKMDLNKERALFVVNFQEIIRQNARAFADQIPDLKKNCWTKYGRPGIGVMMGTYNQPDARVIVGTPQTLSTRTGASKRLYEMLKYGPIDTVIYDEAHYAVAKSYLKMQEALLKANPNLKTIGLTATPQREDGIALSLMFDTICFSRNIKWGIRNGYLCDILPPLVIETNLDLPDGSGSVDERAKALDVGNWSEIITEAYLAHGEDRPTVAFMPSVEHSKRFVADLNARGIAAAHIDGESCIGPDGSELPISARSELFRLSQQGDIKVLSNFNVLIVGWDAPWISCILWARPTSNPVLLTQGIGRGTRLYPGKENLKVLDFTLKDTGILLTGTLLGYTWDDKEKKSEAEDEAEEETFLEGQDLRDMRQSDALYNGQGLVIRVGNLFRKLHEAWYHDPVSNTLSLAASEEAMFVIHSPNYTLANRIQQGIDNGDRYLENEGLSEAERRKAEDFYDTLLLAHDLYSQYTVWYIKKGVNEFTGRPGWIQPGQWFAAADSIELLFDYIAPVLAEIEDPRISKKNQSWRKSGVGPSLAQIELLQKLGVAAADLPSTKDEASRIISHKIAWQKLEPTIEAYRKGCGKYGVLE